MKPYRFHREADAEFTETLRHYVGVSAELGGRFYEEVEAAIAEVCAHPCRFRPIDPPGAAPAFDELPLRAALHR